MLSSYFFKGSWLVQLIVGIGLFLCSFFLEYQILLSFLTPPLLALFLAITLELGKVSAIVWHYYLDHLSAHEYPGAVRLTSSLFRVGLVLLSLLCSQLYLSAHLDRPHLQEVRSDELRAVNQSLHDELARLETQYSNQKASLTARQDREKAAEEEQWNNRIQKLESLLLAEMDNVVNGVFKGARYKEFEQRLAREKDKRQQAMESLRRRHAEIQAELETAFTGRQNKAEDLAEQKRQAIAENDYSVDERVNDPRIVAFLKVFDSIFHRTLLPLQFVFLFSILLSGLMEAGIMLAFSTITIAVSPVFMVHHREAVEKEALMARVTGEAERDGLRHTAAINKIYQAGKQAMKKAEAGLGIAT